VAPYDRKLEGYLPLSPAVYQVLLALGKGPLHGYAIIQEFERRTGRAGALLPGSLYNTIARMVKAGLIVESADRPEEEDDSRRRYYAVTDLGRDVARAESQRLRTLLDMADERAMGSESTSPA